MTLTVAVVGAGIIGRNHTLAMLRLPQLRIVAVVDPIPAAATDLAATVQSGPAGSGPAGSGPAGSGPAGSGSAGSGSAGSGSAGFGPACFASLPEALAAAKPQIVVICTPSGQHVEQALEALAAGAHVVIEKPLDVSADRARPLVAAARSATGQVVSVISQHRFDPATVAIRAAIDAGRLGRLTSAVATVPWWRGQDYYDSAGWRGTRALDGGGALMNQGVHTLDLLLHFLGRPVSVFAYADRLAHTGIEVEDVLVAVLRFASGALATLHATTAAYPGAGVRLEVHGSEGSAALRDDQLEYAALAAGPAGGPLGDQAGGPLGDQAGDPLGDPAGDPLGEPVGGLPGAAVGAPVEDFAGVEPYGAPKPADAFLVGHLRQYADIVDAIVTGRPPAVGVEDGFLALSVVEAIYESAKSGQPVLIDGVS